MGSLAVRQLDPGRGAVSFVRAPDASRIRIVRNRRTLKIVLWSVSGEVRARPTAARRAKDRPRPGQAEATQHSQAHFAAGLEIAHRASDDGESPAARILP